MEIILPFHLIKDHHGMRKLIIAKLIAETQLKINLNYAHQLMVEMENT